MIHLDEVSIHFIEISQLLKKINTRINNQLLIIIDTNVYELYYDIIVSKLSIPDEYIIKFNSTESNKSLKSCIDIWQKLNQLQMRKNDFILGIGGGIVLDITAFISNTWKRGIHFGLIPTTLLAQVDACLGGKTGVNFQHIKNLIGTYANPDFIFICVDFLSTLSHRLIKSGFAEVLKYGLIYDIELWNALNNIKEKNIQSHNWDKIIQICLKIKKEIVLKDKYDAKERKILNFGHTLGHALEAIALDKNQLVYHGEAIAIGMLFASYLSTKYNQLTKSEYLQINQHLDNSGYLDFDLNLLQDPSIFNYLIQDKKNNNKSVQFCLLDKIGHCTPNHPFDLDTIKNELISFHRSITP